MGTTEPAQVPTFRLCEHEGLWYTYTGNRRLAAFRLVHRFAPKRFSHLILPSVVADDSFTRGSDRRRQKLTTAKNGAECQGQWLVIVDTGEAVGRALPGVGEYGHDLLSLLPLPRRPPERPEPPPLD